MIKKYLFCCALALATTTLIAQVPNSFNYQSVVRDGFGVLINSQQLGIKVSIVSDSLGGAVEYSETHSASTNANGLFSIQIGEGTAVSGVFDNIQWETGGLFYQIEIDLQGGSNYSLNSFHSFTSVPYAQHAQTADSLVGFSKNSSGHYLGEFYGGGVIFHLWRDDQGVEHGLICDTTITTAQYSNVYPNPHISYVHVIGDSAQSLWNGQGNSYAIVNQPGHTNSAALDCLNRSAGGFNDWYLPAIAEGALFSKNLYEILRGLKKQQISPRFITSNYDQGHFWSSTEALLYPDNNAFSFQLSPYFQVSIQAENREKKSTSRVMAIRKF